MEETNEAPPPSSPHSIEAKAGSAEIRVDVPITRPELDARFRELRLRIWLTAIAAFMGSAVGGSVKAGINPNEAVLILWRLF